MSEILYNNPTYTRPSKIDGLVRNPFPIHQENKNNIVKTRSDVTSGVVTEATVVDLTFMQNVIPGRNEVGDDFSLRINLTNMGTVNSSFNFKTDNFETSEFKTQLDALILKLNQSYNGSPISYTMNQDERTLTFTHAKGGKLDFSISTTYPLSRGYDADNFRISTKVISGIEEKGGEKDPFFNSEIAFYNSLTSATIEGDGVVDGEASVVTTSSSSSSSSTNTTGIDQITVSTQSGANAALASIDAALTAVNGERSRLGALENRLDHTINNLSNISTNTSAAKSRILDADFAAETANLTKNQILSQAATSMLAQANQSKQSILALLQ